MLFRILHFVFSEDRLLPYGSEEGDSQVVSDSKLTEEGVSHLITLTDGLSIFGEQIANAFYVRSSGRHACQIDYISAVFYLNLQNIPTLCFCFQSFLSIDIIYSNTYKMCGYC